MSRSPPSKGLTTTRLVELLAEAEAEARPLGLLDDGASEGDDSGEAA